VFDRTYLTQFTGGAVQTYSLMIPYIGQSFYVFVEAYFRVLLVFQNM
jgi:hypothetical protein